MAQAHVFEKKHYNYAEWTRGRFSEVVTVTGPAKMLFLAGIGAEAEHEKPGEILHLGDPAGQLRYAYSKLKKILTLHGATMAEIVRQVTYVTDVRFRGDVAKCRDEAYGAAPLPAHTFLCVSQLAWPGMLVEIEVTAVVPTGGEARQ